jgi:hypothetical protein
MARADFPVAIRFRFCFFFLSQEGATSRPRALNSENLVPDCRTVGTWIPDPQVLCSRVGVEV